MQERTHNSASFARPPPAETQEHLVLFCSSNLVTEKCLGALFSKQNVAPRMRSKHVCRIPWNPVIPMASTDLEMSHGNLWVPLNFLLCIHFHGVHLIPWTSSNPVETTELTKLHRIHGVQWIPWNFIYLSSATASLHDGVAAFELFVFLALFCF